MGTQKAWVLALKFRTLKQPCKMWPGWVTSVAGLVCRRAPWPVHQSSCPGALETRTRCWLPGAPSCGASSILLFLTCWCRLHASTRKGVTWIHIQIHLRPPACCCLPRRDAAALLLSLNKSSTCVCDRSFLFQNTGTDGCLFSWDNQLVFFPSRVPTQP